MKCSFARARLERRGNVGPPRLNRGSQTGEQTRERREDANEHQHPDVRRNSGRRRFGEQLRAHDRAAPLSDRDTSQTAERRENKAFDDELHQKSRTTHA